MPFTSCEYDQQKFILFTIAYIMVMNIFFLSAEAYVMYRELAVCMTHMS